jgi:hypothetical protein
MFDFLPADRERVAYRHSVHVDCQVVRERDFRLIGKRTIDLSTTGLLVASELDVNVGESMILSFRAPRSDRYIDAEGVITRISSGRRRGDVARAVGIEFSAIDQASFVALKTTLRRMPPTRPRRPSRLDYAALTRVISML